MIERQLSRSSRAPRSGRPSSGGARRADLELAPKADARAVNRLGGTQHDVITSRGRIRADQVLVATNGYTGPPFRWLQVRLAPVGSFIIVTEPLGKDVCDQLLPTRRMASDSKNLLYYVRITPDRRLLFGGRARFAKAGPRSDQKSGRILRDAMVSVFPQREQARVDYCWGGLVDMSMDRLVHAANRMASSSPSATPATAYRWPPTWASRWPTTWTVTPRPTRGVQILLDATVAYTVNCCARPRARRMT